MLELLPVQKVAGAATRFTDFADPTRSLADSVKLLPKTLADKRGRTVELVAQKVRSPNRPSRQGRHVQPHAKVRCRNRTDGA